MSSSSNEAQPNQELDEMRERIRQYQQQVSQTAPLNRELQQKVDELEVELQGRSPLQSPLSSLQELQQEFDRMDTIIGQFRQMEMELAALMTLNTNLHMRNEELRRKIDALRSTFNTPFSTLPAQNLKPQWRNWMEDGTQPLII